VFAAKHDQGKLRDALGLHQGRHFKKFVQRAKAARHENESEAVFDEANLARKKIMEMDRDIGKTVAALLVRQFDVEADGFAAGLVAPLFAASMMPGPPPVTTARLWCARPLAMAVAAR